ncbi:MAG: glycosyltransferase [Chlamydiae bacterium]|nr:glycosyltransferase [Chlamydiota bacterium]MBI3277613.1 glycosyltransferase [Chlamydiota bacterium]
MDFVKAAFVILYFGILFILSIYGCHRYYLVYLYYRYKKNIPRPKDHFKTLPLVTVQLPIYNEMYVVERLFEAVSKLDYPKELLEIQVLDDSTDETQRIAQSFTQTLQKNGLNIQYLHRHHREGFKAGALEKGLEKAHGEFIYIFDADFIPPSNFIQKTIHFFTDSSIGMVQARWTYLNRNDSLLTEIQSILLDGHFVIEHTARNRSGKFFNFNGTAGGWRRKAITDGGGWQHDTLTEDLDLSYRSQLQGWKFVYLQELGTPSELPVDMNAFKSQQHRWVKGSVQSGKKLLKKIWKSSFPLGIKLEATFHLTNNLSYPLMIILSLLLLPAMLIQLEEGWKYKVLIDAPLFIASFLSISIFYISSQKEIDAQWFKKLKYIPLVSAVGIGLSINNAKAVLEALFSHESPFQRTPKYGAHTSQDSLKTKKYRGKKNKFSWVELILGLYFSLLATISLETHRFAMTPFLMLFQIGYLYTWSLSIFQERQKPLQLLLSKPIEA